MHKTQCSTLSNTASSVSPPPQKKKNPFLLQVFTFQLKNNNFVLLWCITEMISQNRDQHNSRGQWFFFFFLGGARWWNSSLNVSSTPRWCPASNSSRCKGFWAKVNNWNNLTKAWWGGHQMPVLQDTLWLDCSTQRCQECKVFCGQPWFLRAMRWWRGGWGSLIHHGSSRFRCC